MPHSFPVPLAPLRQPGTAAVAGEKDAWRVGFCPVGWCCLPMACCASPWRPQLHEHRGGCAVTATPAMAPAFSPASLEFFGRSGLRNPRATVPNGGVCHAVSCRPIRSAAAGRQFLNQAAQSLACAVGWRPGGRLIQLFSAPGPPKTAPVIEQWLVSPTPAVMPWRRLLFRWAAGGRLTWSGKPWGA